MNKTSPVLVSLAVGAVCAHATWYTNEATFLANIDSSYYLEDFSDFSYGSPLAGDASWDAPGANGYGWTASAANGLWSNDSALSTNASGDPIVIDFTGNPVTAFGGNFANTDISGNILAGTTTVAITGGDSMSIDNPQGQEVFLGWVGSTSVSEISISNADWAQVDHFYTGAEQAVPEPMSLIGLAGGALALARRRRKA